MTTPAAWMASRRPAAPAPLAAWLLREVEGRQLSSASLMDAGLAALDRARAHPGKRRASAFELLGADALITHACEVALDEGAPAESLTEFIRAAAAHRR